LITDILPKPQVQAFQLPVHISYFLQKCKKGKPSEISLPLLKNDITGSEPISKLGIHSRTHNYFALSLDTPYCGSLKNEKRGYLD